MANPNNYLIVPANYTEQQARAFAAKVAGTMGLGPIGQALALKRMKDAFWPNGSQDLQRDPQWGIPENSFVPAFTGGTSYHLGSVSRWAGLPETLSEIGGGIPHWFSRPSVQTKFPGLSQRNYEDISKGFADADVPRNAASPMYDFGYNPQTQYPSGQIGDGNGLGVGDWRFAFAGIDPSNPTRPVPPLLTDSQPAPGLVRVNRNNSLPSPAASAIPSGNQNSFGDRFGNWSSAPTNATPPSAPDRTESFDKRFGDWGSAPAGGFGDAKSPVLRALEKKRSEIPDGSAWTSAQGSGPASPALRQNAAYSPASDFIGNSPLVGNSLISPAEAAPAPLVPWPSPTEPDFSSSAPTTGQPTPAYLSGAKNGAPVDPVSGGLPGRLAAYMAGTMNPTQTPPPGMIRASGNNLPAPAMDGNSPVPPPGIASGQPIPQWGTLLPLANLFGLPKTSGNGDWSNFLAGLVSPDAPQPAPPQQAADGKPERRLGRRILNPSPAPAFDVGSAAAPLAPSRDPTFSPDDEQDQCDLRALDARLSSSGSIRDAVALYDALRSRGS